MKKGEIKKLLAITIAVSMLTPAAAMAAEVNTPQTGIEQGNTEGEAGAGTEIPENPETTVPENPEPPAPPENSTPENPEAPAPETPPAEETQQMTPSEYEAKTGYKLPEGFTYKLQNGYVILKEDGTVELEAISAQPEENPQNPEENPADENQNPEEAPAEKPATNEELIAQQEIIQMPEIVQDFRFWTVSKKYAFAKEDVHILEAKEENARAAGSLPKDGVCYVLKEEEDGWLYVESGTVRGFVQADYILAGEEAEEIIEAKIAEAKEETEKRNKEYTGIADFLVEAKEELSTTENQAFLYTRSTVRQTVIEKTYALCTSDQVNIREDKNTDSRIVGVMNKNALSYVLADADEEWVYVESGDVRGFVNREFLNLDEKQEEVAKSVEEAGEDTFATAEEKIETEENTALYYTITSVKSGVPDGELRNSVLEFAGQFVGNPYVWGGTSLTEGADCSGFVQSVFAQYGYSLPRVAEDQAQYGTKIAVEDAQPGDLIFYARDGYIYHVVMYAGDGKTIEAMDTAHGITQGTVNTANAVWAVRVLDDGNAFGFYGSDIGEVNASAGQYGQCLGTYKITHYCGGSCCNDEWAGVTSTGAPLVEGDTIAVDPSIIPYGTKVIINGHIFTAADCGGAIKGNRIDVFVNSHDKANALGVYYTDVYVLK